MFDWVRRKKDATIDGLVEQMQHAEQAHRYAEQAVADAERQFDDDGSDRSAKALTEARDHERTTAEHLRRARRLISNRVAELAESVIIKHRNEQQRLRGPVTDELRERYAEAEAKVNAAAEELDRARRHLGGIDRQLDDASTQARDLGDQIDRVHKNYIEEAGQLDPANPDELRRLVLQAQILEKEISK